MIAILVGPTVTEANAQDSEEAERLELTTSSDAAKQHFWAGMTDALNIFPSRAAMHFGMALDADPNLALAIVLDGFTRPGLGGSQRQARIAEGIAALDGASTNEMLVGIAFKEWAGGDAAAAGRLFRTARSLMPGDPYVATYATQLAGARGDRTDAIRRWQGVIDEFPDQANLHNTIAYQYSARGNEGAALASVRRYVELLPDHPNAADSYAEQLQFVGRYPEAFAEYQRAADLDPNFNQAFMGLAEILVLVGAGDGAGEAIAQAIEHAPSPAARVTAMRALANTHMIGGDRDAALGQLQQALTAAADLDGPRTITYQQMALTDAILGDGRFVAEYLGEAAAIGGDDTPVHLAMSGLAYAASDQVAMAREASEQLADAPGPFWQSLAAAINGMVLLQEGQPEAALEALADANPGDPVVQAVMAEAYDRLERPAAAAAMRANVIGNRQINLANPFQAFARVRVGEN
jgi:tetratricopeptide (TPR) repeat protein